MSQEKDAASTPLPNYGEIHGVSCALRNNGNDGYASITEDENGQVVIKVVGPSRTRANTRIEVRPSEDD